jgi:hypothetical protein
MMGRKIISETFNTDADGAKKYIKLPTAIHLYIFIYICKIIVPVLNYASHHGGVGGSGCTNPRFLHLGTIVGS